MAEGRVLDLYLVHRSRLVSYADRLLGDRERAEDVVQDAWLRFDAAARGGMFEGSAGYLYRMVRNLSIDRRRHMALEARHDGGSVDEVAERTADRTPSQETAAIDRDDLARVQAAIAALPERTRIALEMHRFGGCKLREIADRLGISTSRAQALVSEGIARCREALVVED